MRLMVCAVAGVGLRLSRSVIAVRLVMPYVIPVIVQMSLMRCHCIPLKNGKKFYRLVRIYQINSTLSPSKTTVLCGPQGLSFSTDGRIESNRCFIAIAIYDQITNSRTRPSAWSVLMMDAAPSLSIPVRARMASIVSGTTMAWL